MLATEIDTTTPIVARVLNIEDVTLGDVQKNYLARYRGHLRCESSEAYDLLANDLRPRNITPLFRTEENRHVVILMPGVVIANPSNPYVNLLMFGLTLFSVFLVGAAYVYDGPPDASFTAYILYSLAHIWRGWPFAVALLSILLAHEFGHYLMGRHHGTSVTLPYFLPLPLPSSFGTLGAFIQMKEPPKNRRILMDIGLAGPLSGLIVAIPVLLIGLSLSKVGMINLAPGDALQLEGNSLLYLLLKYVTFGRLLPDPASYGSLHPALYWLQYFFTGQPLPMGGLDVQLHPVAWAGWAGLLVTALNLIPAGQLDGGHLMYVLLGERSSRLLPYILTILVLLGFVWPGWWLWAFLIFFLGRRHAEPLDQITPLDSKRKAMAVVGLIVFLLVFTPVPLVVAVAGM